MEKNLNARSEDTFFLERGYVYFSKSPTKIQTVLGTCVAVCLWDKKQKFGGMNHFMHPVAKESSKATPIFGNAAMTALLRIMEKAGSRTADIIAQIFGGGQPDKDSENELGQKNINIARTFLNNKGIKIVSEDVGGSLGRKIIFDTGSGHVAVLKVDNIRQSDWHY